MQHSPRRPTVVHVLAALEASGAERLLECLAPAARDDVDAHVVSTGEDGIGGFAPALRAVGYRTHHVPFARRPRWFLDLLRLLRALRVEVLHVHCERAAFWIALAGRLAGARRVVRTVHALFRFSGTLRARRSLHRWLVRRVLSGQTIVLSQAVARNEAKHFGNPSILLPAWIDGRRFAPGDADGRSAARAALGLRGPQFAVALVGSCQTIKNHDAAIVATARLADRGFDVVLLHAGDGPLQAHEAALAERLGIADRVRFLGVVPSVETVLQAADQFVMPSYREGFGLAALEAMACGVPVVLSDVEGLRDLGQHGGSIRWSGPDAESLAAALVEAIEQGEVPTRPIDLADRTPAAAWASLRSIYGLDAPHPLGAGDAVG